MALHTEHDYARMADGCRNVFIDTGANIGIHARILFEPHLYPKANYTWRVFDPVFGADRDRSKTCAFEIEPNPEHAKRHQSKLYN